MDAQLTGEEIQDQLGKILDSPGFSQAPQLTSFLRFVVMETLAGRGDQINQYAVATKAFGRTSDFDPTVDPIVRISARRLRRTLDYYYRNEQYATVRIDIPKGRYIPTFSNLSPSSTLMNDGPRPEPAISDLSEPVVLPGPTSNDRVIAVIPFVQSDADPKQEYFAFALTERVVEALTLFPTCVVIGPLSREKLAADSMGPRAIGREFGARFLLDGTVRWDGNTVEVNAKLVESKSAANVWTRTFSGEIGTISLVELEEQIAGQVAATIADDLGPVSRLLMAEAYGRSDAQLQLYDAVLRGIHALNVMELSKIKDAVSILKAALATAPESSLATGLLAEIYANSYAIGWDEVATTLDDAERLARRAVGLDPTEQNARNALAFVHMLRHRRVALLREVEILISLNANRASLLGAAAQWLALAGEPKRSEQLQRRALQLNPHLAGWHYYTTFVILFHRAQFEDALLVTDNFTQPDYFGDPLLRAVVLGKLERREEAAAALADVRKLRPDLFSGIHGRTNLADIVKRLWTDEELQAMVLNGLHMAGLDQ